MTSNYMQDLFNPGVNPSNEEQQQPTRSAFFNPNANNAQDKKYSAVIRFLPWYEEPNRSILKKEVAWLKNDVTNESRPVDSPATIGERCPIKDMFFTLWRSNHEADKEIAKAKFSVRTQYFSLIQVIEDKVNPTNNGKILIWRYGMKIHDKINQEMNNEFTPRNPFSVMDGRYFHVNVKVDGGYNNYDSCAFVDIASLPSELQFYNENGEVYGKADPSDPEALVNYLQSGPSLKEVDFQPWDDSTRAFVDGVIRAFTDPINYSKTLNNGAPQPAQPTQTPMFSTGVTPPQQAAQPASKQAEFITNITSNINEANAQPESSGSVDGLNFDDILSKQMF